MVSALGVMQDGEVQAEGWQREFRATLKLAWPLILANLTMATIQAIDTFFLGQYGARELAAAALGINMGFLLNLIGLGIITAASPMMASALGRGQGKVKDVRRTFRQSFWLVITLTIPIWLLLANAEPLIGLLGQEPELAANAQTFLNGWMWSAFFFLLFNAMRNFLSALERPGWVLAISAAGIPVNSLLDYMLIFGRFGAPELGLFGAGLATTITWALMVGAIIIVILRDRQFRRYHLFARFWKADWTRYRHMWVLGLPIGAAMGAEGGVFAAAAYLMGLISAESLAAHAIALQIAALTFMVPWGIAQAATVRVGIMLGRGDKQGIGRAGNTAWLMGVGFMSMTALIMWTFPSELIGIFLADTPENAPVLELGVSFLIVAAIFQIVDGAQVVGAGILRGLHDTRVPMIFTFLGYWLVGIGIAVWLGFGLGWDGVGIWAGLAAGLAMVAVLMGMRWRMRERLGLTSDEPSKKIAA